MRKLSGMLLGVAATFAVAGSAAAQDLSKTAKAYSFEIRPTVGIVFPLSPDGLDTGWDIGASFRAMPPTWPIGIQLDVFLVDVGSSELMLNANAVYHFQTSSETFQPYLIAGLGIFDGNFAINGGAGADFAIGSSPIGFFADIRFHNIFIDGPDAVLMPINAGVRIRF